MHRLMPKYNGLIQFCLKNKNHQNLKKSDKKN